MKRNTLFLLIPFFCLMAVSCREDISIRQNPFEIENDGYHIPISVDISETRTRAVDMTPGAAVYLKNLWIGVYDKETGDRVGGTGPDGKGGNFTDEIILGNRLVASGNEIIDMISIGYGDNFLSGQNKYCVVGVANYDGIKVLDGSDLYTTLSSASKWSDFIKIAIDTQNSDFETQTPMLMGYLIKEDAETQGYTKVDQFSSGISNINLTDYGDVSNIYLSATNSGVLTTKYGTKNFILKLRRLRSKINVLINETEVPGIKITNLQYKVFNKPKSAFLAQRKTNVMSDNSKLSEQFSPNSGDVLKDSHKDNKGFYDDEDWIIPPISSNFSFEHFENKHWAKNTDQLIEYHDREKNDRNKENPLFNVLADDAEEWNNNASYFVLQLSIRDENKNRNAIVEYTIHEGFINDEYGVENKDDLTSRLKDFSCIRNTDYYYNITVNGVDDINVQVSTSGSHTNDQEGKIWQINYLTNKNALTGKTENFVETIKDNYNVDTKLHLKDDSNGDFDNSDIAFRLVGTIYDSSIQKDVLVDVCYNFGHGFLNGFNGLWPAPSNADTEYIVKTGEGENEVSAFDNFKNFYTNNQIKGPYFNQLAEKIRIKYNNEYITIKEYIEKIQTPSVNPDIDGFQFDSYIYYIGYDENEDRKNHLYGLYIFDLQKALENGSRIMKDDDECSFFYQLNAAEQYPAYLTKETHVMRYATNSSSEYISNNVTNSHYLDNMENGGSDGKKGMLLSETPDMAFRILGFDGDSKNYYDIFYNLGLKDYSDFNGEEWPEINLNNVLSTTIEKGLLASSSLPQSFLDGFKVLVKNSNGNTTAYDINTFIKDYENGILKLSKDDKLGFEVNKYDKICYSQDQDKKHSYMRALYLLDKKGKDHIPAIYNAESHEATFEVYAAQQFPDYKDPTKLSLPTGLPSNQVFNTVNFIKQNVGEIELPLLANIPTTDYLYKIIVRDNSGRSSESVIDLTKVTLESNGKFKYNIPTSAVPGTGGSIYLQVIANEEKYVDSDISTTPIGTISLSNKTWDFASNSWTNFARESNDWTGSGSYKLNSNTSSTYDDLTFICGNSKTVELNGSNLNLGNSGNTCAVQFTVYKDCKVRVTTEVKNGRTLSVIGGDPASIDISINGTNTSTIKLGDYDHAEVQLYFGGGGARMYKIELLPAD